MSEIGQKIIAEIRKVADEHPDRVIPAGACTYLDEDAYYSNGDYKPSCLVGHALCRLDRIPESDPDEGIDRWNAVAFRNVCSCIGDLEPHEVDWVQEAQDAQDGQARWADAVETADMHVAADDE